MEGQWERITNITADNPGNKYVLYGIQMKSSYKYFRAIAHFTFSHNEEVPLAEPVLSNKLLQTGIKLFCSVSYCRRGNV